MFLRRAFNVPSLNVCLLGRWVLYIPTGTIMHERISATPAKAHECTVGWITHYAIGAGFAVVLVLTTSTAWLDNPTLWPALAFGIATTIVPFFTMQPAFGLGIASSKTPNPNKARLKSLTTHTVFGVGLYLWAYFFSYLPLRW